MTTDARTSKFAIDSIMDKEMAWAIEQKRGCKVDDDNAFTMRVTIVGPGGQLARVPLQWTSMDDKHRKMEVLSDVCRHTYARAAIITTDTRYLLFEEFCKHFKLAFPMTNEKVFRDDYSRIMADYNYEMERLPRQLWQEALNVVAYGPRIAKMMLAKYSIVNRAYVFEPPETIGNSEERVEVGMIPAWWQ